MRRQGAKFILEELTLKTCLTEFQQKMYLRYLEENAFVVMDVFIQMLDRGKDIWAIDGPNHSLKNCK